MRAQEAPCDVELHIGPCNQRCVTCCGWEAVGPNGDPRVSQKKFQKFQLQMIDNRQKFLTLLWSLCCLTLLAGCCGTPRSHGPIAEFERKHPEEFEQYAYLNAISLDTYKAVWGEKAGAASYILDETERLFGKTDGVKDFVKRMAEREGENRRRILAFFRELEDSGAGGGVVCQYEWSDGETRETGFLVVKSGEIIKREPWVTDYLVEQQQ